ncbi:MAG: hypothetical protein CYG60_10905 [Actinobacteria bacterium]|nr:MAG: hypothetical protein CYG60_10905 [Actinomycetota bacterium]
MFTYQHNVAGAWHALASAMVEAGLSPIQVFPLLGDGNAGSHNHEGTSKWDAVFVVVKDGGATPARPLNLSEAQSEHVRAHYDRWAKRLSKMTEGKFREADRRNFFRACLVAGALGMFSCPEAEGKTPLAAALKQPPPSSTEQKDAPDASVV